METVPTLACSSSHVGSTINLEATFVKDVTRGTFEASSDVAAKSSSETLNSLCSSLSTVMLGILKS